MKLNLRVLVWAVALMAGFLVVSSSPAHAQACTSICNSNTNCNTSCTIPAPRGGTNGPIGNVEFTTCGDGGFPCCTDQVTTTLYCTAQFLNSNSVCVQVEIDAVTDTCGTNSTTTFVTHKQKAPDPSGQNCPSSCTPGCEQFCTP
jgi:hypothetical protein